MIFDIILIAGVDQKQFNYHIKSLYGENIKSIVPYEGKITVKADITEQEKTEIENYYTSLIGGLSDSDYEKHLLKNSYFKKELDGIDYYNKKRSDQVYKIMTGVTTSNDSFYIHLKTKEVKNAILTGDWITAYREVLLTNIDAVYTQDIKDEFITEISDYINNNYPLGTLGSL